MKVKFWLLSILLVLSMMPVGHLVVMLLREIESNQLWIIAHLSIGLLGIWLVLKGNEKAETPASIFGFVAAHLIFIGFFELTFAFVAQVLNIAPILDPKTNAVLLAPSLQVVELSGLLLLPLLLLMCVSAEVRCNMMLWCRRKLAIKLPVNTASKKRAYASITANETIFVIWTIYVISLVCLDPRVLGPTHWLSMLIYTAFMFWPFYLIYRVRKFSSSGYVFRYSIPIGVLLWSWVEMLSSMNLIVEYYLYPFEYPFASTLTLLTAIALGYFSLAKQR